MGPPIHSTPSRRRRSRALRAASPNSLSAEPLIVQLLSSADVRIAHRHMGQVRFASQLTRGVWNGHVEARVPGFGLFFKHALVLRFHLAAQATAFLCKSSVFG